MTRADEFLSLLAVNLHGETAWGPDGWEIHALKVAHRLPDDMPLADTARAFRSWWLQHPFEEHDGFLL